MSAVTVCAVRSGFYLDSVALMRISARIAALPGVQEAALMIGSVSNRQILADAGLLSDDPEVAAAGANDLLIGVRADARDAADAALAAAEAALDGDDSGVARHPSGGASARPRDIDDARAQLPDANLALISVPGEFAAREARQALAAGLNVMLFSDNVSVDDERSLKLRAREHGLIVMGPDCGTALIGGVPLAFANAVPRQVPGVGVIAASGTGLQEVSVLLARAGRGLSHGIGVGGRDLSDAVGAVSTLTALDWLEHDDDTDSVILIAKPPGEQTGAQVLERLSGYAKPVVVCFLGYTPDPALAAERRALRFVFSLREAAELAAGQTIGGHFVHALEPAASASERRWLRGLYCGGTLCAEAQLLLDQAGVAVLSNAPAPGIGAVAAKSGAGADISERAHLLLDLGADEYTIGRPHPMIEPAPRDALLADALADPQVAVVLLDVVLGYGAHPDPAAGIVSALAAAPAERPAVLASVCGVDGDPQDYAAQVAALEQAGVVVAPSNAHAAELAASLLSASA